MKRRLRLGLAALLMVVAAGLFTAVASADSSNSGLPGALNGSAAPAFDPQETNIASLAWRGEELRFVKCSPAIPDGLAIYGNEGVPGFWAPNTINFFVEDFSGDPHYQPHPVVGTFSYTTKHDTDGQVNCVRGDFVSNKPGLAMIKLVVTDELGNKVLEHQFLAGWMAIGPSTVTPTDTTVSEPAGFGSANDITIQVSGTIPLDDEWQSDWNLPGSLTMPNDWPLLASKIASTSRALRVANPSVAAYKYWDIHDSSGPDALGGDGGLPDIHVPGYCPPPNNTSTTIDQVDNCVAPLGILGPFSRVFGDNTTGTPNQIAVGDTMGPFDPQYPEETLLSDGNLNALDAPMPQLRIDVTSTGNTGSFQQINGANLNSIKFCKYSRASCLSPAIALPHNFYAPFYAAWIPATYRDLSAPDASGTDGPQPWYTDGARALGNNFEGYLAGNQEFPGAYIYWLFADVLVNAEPQETNCLLRNDEGTSNRFTNSGPQSVAVYTDEHGEAVVVWSPGLDNDLFGDLGPDDNGACDIQGMDLGGADITAVARYPFQNVAAPVAIGGTLHKAVENLFNKAISCRLKNNGPNGGVVYICTATAQDIDGSGEVFNGEDVCISREPAGLIYPFPRGTSGGSLDLCVTLHGGDADSPASASVEFPATLVGSVVDVSAYFSDENIWRDTCITVGEPGPTDSGPCGGPFSPPPPVTNPGGGTSNPDVHVVSPQNSTTSITGGAAQTAQTGNTVKSIKASVVSAKVVKTRNGRALVVKVQSPNKTATIRIVLVGKNGKVLVRTVRTIKANKSVRISHLLVPRSVKAVHVNVLR